MKIHKSICQNCVYRYHPVMLTTYLPSPGKCDACRYKPGELAMVYFEDVLPWEPAAEIYRFEVWRDDFKKNGVDRSPEPVVSSPRAAENDTPDPATPDAELCTQPVQRVSQQSRS